MRNRYNIYLYQFGNSNLWQKGKAVTAIFAEFKLEPLKEPPVLFHWDVYVENWITIIIVMAWSSEKAKADFWLEANTKQLMRWDHGFCFLRISLIVVVILQSLSCMCSGSNCLENFLTNYIGNQFLNIKH